MAANLHLPLGPSPFDKADQWIFFYASLATSGSEGTALSRERDQFGADLVRLYGGDPVKP